MQLASFIKVYAARNQPAPQTILFAGDDGWLDLEQFKEASSQIIGPGPILEYSRPLPDIAEWLLDAHRSTVFERQVEIEKEWQVREADERRRAQEHADMTAKKKKSWLPF